jgi:hypothetical protein
MYNVVQQHVQIFLSSGSRWEVRTGTCHVKYYFYSIKNYIVSATEKLRKGENCRYICSSIILGIDVVKIIY